MHRRITRGAFQSRCLGHSPQRVCFRALEFSEPLPRDSSVQPGWKSCPLQREDRTPPRSSARARPAGGMGGRTCQSPQEGLLLAPGAQCTFCFHRLGGGGLEFLFPHRHPCVTDASGLGHAESHSLTAKEPIISGGGGREAQRGQQIAFLLLRVRDVWSSPPLPADHHLAVSFIQLRTDTGQDASVLFVA